MEPDLESEMCNLPSFPNHQLANDWAKNRNNGCGRKVGHTDCYREFFLKFVLPQVNLSATFDVTKVCQNTTGSLCSLHSALLQYFVALNTSSTDWLNKLNNTELRCVGPAIRSLDHSYVISIGSGAAHAVSLDAMLKASLATQSKSCGGE